MLAGRGQGTRTQTLVVIGVLIATALLASFLPTRSRGAASVASVRPAAEADVIVRFAPSVAPKQQRAIVRAAGGTVTHDLHIIGGVGARMTRPAAERLRAAMGVVSVAFAAPVESRGNEDVRSTFSRAIGAARLWEVDELTGRRVGVAIVDTGIAGDLPEFQVSRYNRRSRVSATAVVNPHAQSDDDGYGHGTHVAGIIGGDGTNRRGAKKRNGNGFMGVAPDAELISIKISDDEGRASTLDAIYGIQFAVDHAEELDIRVLNLSFASAVAESPATDPLDAAAEAAWLHGLVVVAAAGNDGDEAGAVSHAPGNDPYVITVGATDDKGTDSDADDATTPWSSNGETQTGVAKPEVVAPGSQITSTLAPDSMFAQLCPECIVGRHYFRAGGTSMAAAVVSGAAALVIDAHPDWTPDQVKAALIQTARNVPGGRQIRVDKAVDAEPDAKAVMQRWPLNQYINPATGAIDYTAASWRAASWRLSEEGPAWTAASWRCDCSLTENGELDPQAASWRAASWRTSFTK